MLAYQTILSVYFLQTWHSLFKDSPLKWTFLSEDDLPNLSLQHAHITASISRMCFHWIDVIPWWRSPINPYQFKQSLIGTASRDRLDCYQFSERGIQIERASSSILLVSRFYSKDLDSQLGLGQWRIPIYSCPKGICAIGVIKLTLHCIWWVKFTADWPSRLDTS